MYEEEDDDLPAQYRRLTAHLNTNSYEFNRRLQSMIATQVGTRQALMEQSGHYFFPQQAYPNMPYFAPQTMQPGMQSQMLPPQMMSRSPISYRQQPYPSPQTPHQQFQQRSASIATPNEVPGFTQNQTTSPVEGAFDDQRRMSVPSNSASMTPQSQPTSQKRPSGSRAASNAQNSPAGTPSPVTTMSPSLPQHSQPQAMMSQYPFMAPIPMYDMQSSNMSPFSTALPMESQQILGGSLDPMNPMSQYLMAGSDYMSRQYPSQPFYSYKPNAASMTRPPQMSSAGMNATLAPNHFDMDSPENTFGSSNAPSVSTDGVSTPFTSSYPFNSNDFVDVKGQFLSGNNSTQGSGTVTPSCAEPDFFNWVSLDDHAAVSASL